MLGHLLVIKSLVTAHPWYAPQPAGLLDKRPNVIGNFTLTEQDMTHVLIKGKDSMRTYGKGIKMLDPKIQL